MHGTILIYGNDEMLLVTRSLILKRAGYNTVPAQTFSEAMLALMNQVIDVFILCQTLNEEERRGILETAHALQPEVKCASLGFDGGELMLDGVDMHQQLDGPPGLLLAIGRMLTRKESGQMETLH